MSGFIISAMAPYLGLTAGRSDQTLLLNKNNQITMKRNVLVFAFLILSGLSYSQSVKYKAFQSLITYKDNDGYYTKHLGWVDCDIVLTIDLNKRKIHVYNGLDADYDIITFIGGEYKDEEGDSWVRMKCVDKDGKMCYIRQVYRTPAGSDITEDRIFVDYGQVTFGYRLKIE